ncbi:hypothetical protein LPW26_03410 [Rhodopseudomonas sp. HC1]|uniref:hypothetical protein n=1 Tax=Rhodopseudomonas infernalis TaxID=2897386 RepID=UPI001EE87645|nr:hypothetical protein [Rhodopseudomonas infernalis]MCG6203674.1 hypothetical protein [Rhodopseudomonas infernalis]
MSAADAAFDMLSVLHPAFAFGVIVFVASALSTACELIGAAIGDLVEAGGGRGMYRN